MPQVERSVLFVDIAGSTGLYERLGDTRALKVIEKVLKFMAAITAKFQGRVVKTIGDELLCLFPDSASALLAASEMQNRLSDQQPGDGRLVIAVRIAFRHGPLIEEGGDVFGDTVNVAARLASLAQAWQIITDGPTVRSLPPYLRSTNIRPVDAFRLRGKEESVDVCEVIWRYDEDMTMMAGHPEVHATPTPSQTLGLRNAAGREWQVGPGRVTLHIGRDPASDVVIADRMASRRHGRIELRRGKFIYVDTSSNGTVVQFDEGETIVVKREEALLLGSGSISFGRPANQGAEEVLRFSLSGSEATD